MTDELVVAECDRQAAAHAAEHWHYAKTMPVGKLVTYGIWEHNRYVGAIIYGRGANDRLLQRYNLKQNEGCELVRVALRQHQHPVTQLIANTLQQLTHSNPGLRLVVSFADPTRNHHGGIYQAGNWIYTGQTNTTREFIINGHQTHERTVSSMMNGHTLKPDQTRLDWLQTHVHPNTQPIHVPGKHRYLMPLDRAMRRKLRPLAQPYPRGGSVDSDTLNDPLRDAGATPAHRSKAIH